MPWMESKFDSKCAGCGDWMAQGDKMYYNGQAYCYANGCGDEAEREDNDKQEKVNDAKIAPEVDPFE